MNMFELLHQTALADTDLLRKNDAMGDIFTIARGVDFASETEDEQRAHDFAEFVNGKSYGKAAVRKTSSAMKQPGLRHHVALSVVGTERLAESGYFRARLLRRN